MEVTGQLCVPGGRMPLSVGRRLDGLQKWSRCCGEDIPLPMPGIKPHFLVVQYIAWLRYHRNK
jgi:hypothetical protein